VRGFPVDFTTVPDTREPAVRPEDLPRLWALVAGRPRFWLVTVTPDQAPHVNIPLVREALASAATSCGHASFAGVDLFCYQPRAR
jgi:hypothetical protein